VTVGSDSGHETAGGFDGRFALNAESFANFGRLQIKKTHDVAMTLVQKAVRHITEALVFHRRIAGRP
jgi:hypothetical protein